MHGGWGWGMMVFWGVLLLAAAAAIVWLFGRSQRAGAGIGGVGESPVDILKKRYARGEIGRDEFEEKKRDIE